MMVVVHAYSVRYHVWWILNALQVSLLGCPHLINDLYTVCTCSMVCYVYYVSYIIHIDDAIML